jgi:hypothetical protein
LEPRNANALHPAAMERMTGIETYIREGHSIKDQDCRDYTSFTGTRHITRWDYPRTNLDRLG